MITIIVHIRQYFLVEFYENNSEGLDLICMLIFMLSFNLLNKMHSINLYVEFYYTRPFT